MRLDVGDLPLFVETRGEGLPLLLVHAFGAHRFTWRNWADALARRYRLYLIDLKGFGDAPKPAEERYSPGDHADILSTFLLRHGLEGALYCGHSLGGGVGLLTALRLTDLGARPLSAIVDIAGPAFPQPLPPLISLARTPGAHFAVRAMPAEMMVRKALEFAYHPRVPRDPEMVDGYARTLRGLPASRALIQSARQIEPPNLRELIERYPSITTPTLLVWGRQDPVVPLSVGQRLVRLLPNAELHILEDCGHVPQDERPGKALEVVLSFLERVERVCEPVRPGSGHRIAPNVPRVSSIA
jgi:pimeloyl-ACP methyl ester carboxylesterase